VWRRDEHLIANEAQLDVRLPFEPYDDRLAPGKMFTCMENVTIYFEAYRHVLVALQSMRPADVPFQHTLLNPQPEASPPAFVRPDSDMWHFHNVFQSCEKPDCAIAPPKSFRVLQEWPDTLQASLDIDPSQLDAIHHALTHQMALIQGPPGTGKTWVGLKIVQALLDNTGTCRHSPMLVVCYTNHALDQFLEGIYRFTGRIARIGSRSKSETLQTRNLKELVSEIQPSKEYFSARKGLMERRDTLREQLSKCLADVDRHYVELGDVLNILTERQFKEFYEGYLSYLGDDRKGIPTDPDEVDDELWERIMKDWLETSGDLTKFAPIAKKPESEVEAARRLLKDAEDEEENDEEKAKKAQELANDAEEEEAEHERHDRKLDVEEVDPKKQSFGDFFMELKNAWLPWTEDHISSLRPELRSLQWRDEEDLWRLPLSARRETYKQWLLETHHQAREDLPEISRQLERNALHRAALERDKKLAVLREMEVVGMTTTAVSKYQVLLKELRPEVVIVEEAAEVLEAHILTALHPRTQHVILIGDHQQLRPSTAVYRLSKNFHLDVSLFERLIHNGADHVTLLQQRRMHPKVSRLIKPLYPLLRDHRVTSDYPEIMGINARCFFLSHDHFEDDEGESHSKANTFEANFIAALSAHLVKSGYDESQITILSPYLGQVRTLKNKLRRDPTTQNVAITAVDNFQGEENDIILISLVRSNRNKSMGFLAVDNRINVALTRARHGMFIVGNADMLRGHTLWGQIITELKTDSCIGPRMPLLTDGGDVFEVSSCDDISVLLGDPLHETGAEECGGFSSFGGSPVRDTEVAERWRDLGKEDKPEKGKGRGQGNRDRDWVGGGKGGRDRDRDYGNSKGGRDRDKGGSMVERQRVPNWDEEPELGSSRREDHERGGDGSRSGGNGKSSPKDGGGAPAREDGEGQKGSKKSKKKSGKEVLLRLSG